MGSILRMQATTQDPIATYFNLTSMTPLSWNLRRHLLLVSLNVLVSMLAITSLLWLSLIFPQPLHQN